MAQAVAKVPSPHGLQSHLQWPELSAALVACWAREEPRSRALASALAWAADPPVVVVVAQGASELLHKVAKAAEVDMPLQGRLPWKRAKAAEVDMPLPARLPWKRQLALLPHWPQLPSQWPCVPPPV